jgi:competence protein ComEC
MVLLASCLALFIGLISGIFTWSLGEYQVKALEDQLQDDPQRLYELVICEDPKQGAISQTSVAEVDTHGLKAIKVRIFWNQQQTPSALGMHLKARVKLKPLTESQEFLYQRGIVCSVSLEDSSDQGFGSTPIGWIHAFREHNSTLLAERAGEGSALLRGVLLGDTTALDSSQAGQAFKVTGLSHLVAVSGSHLVVIAVLVAWLIGRLRLNRTLELTLITSLLVAYVILTGLQPSAIRSCIMAFTASLSPLIGRRAHIPSALAAAACAMLVFYPPTAFSIGFWLSVFAVFGLTLFCPLINGFLKNFFLPDAEKSGTKQRLRRRFFKMILAPLGLTITAQLATLPITAPLFATIPLVSPLANLLVTPLIGILVGVGIALLCLMPILGPLGSFLLGVLCALADCANLLASFCAQIPYACIPVSVPFSPFLIVCLLLAIVLYVFWPQPSRKLFIRTILVGVLISMIFITTTFLPVKPQMVTLDVGQGDALLVRDGTSTVLIDTGSSNTLLVQALARHRVTHLNAVVLTHLDDDHCGALEALIGVVAVDEVYFSKGLLDAQSDCETFEIAAFLLGGKRPQELSLGDTLDLGKSVELTMVWPRDPSVKGGNEESICLALDYDYDSDNKPESRMLLTGDAEAPQIEHILLGIEDVHFNVLKVGHHGSKDAITLSQLELMGCQLACISVGASNRYGHPTPETLAILEEANLRIYRTDLHGDITVYFSGNRLTVHCATIPVDLSSS